MKKISLTVVGYTLLALNSFSQMKENGKIYITHPNINAVLAANEAYLHKDVAANQQYFSDTAKV